MLFILHDIWKKQYDEKPAAVVLKCDNEHMQTQSSDIWPEVSFEMFLFKKILTIKASCMKHLWQAFQISNLCVIASDLAGDYRCLVLLLSKCLTVFLLPFYAWINWFSWYLPFALTLLKETTIPNQPLFLCRGWNMKSRTLLLWWRCFAPSQLLNPSESVLVHIHIRLHA